MSSRSKRYSEISEKIDTDKIYKLDEGIELIKDSQRRKKKMIEFSTKSAILQT